jgi:hypothetical protein
MTISSKQHWAELMLKTRSCWGSDLQRACFAFSHLFLPSFGKNWPFRIWIRIPSISIGKEENCTSKRERCLEKVVGASSRLGFLPIGMLVVGWEVRLVSRRRYGFSPCLLFSPWRNYLDAWLRAQGEERASSSDWHVGICERGSLIFLLWMFRVVAFGGSVNKYKDLLRLRILSHVRS